jgi:hypothetical protein
LAGELDLPGHDASITTWAGNAHPVSGARQSADRRGDADAAGQRLSVVGGQRPGEHDQVGDPRVGHFVVGEPPVAAACHVPTVGQAGQVRRHSALGQPDTRYALGHRVLAAEQELQQPQPGRVAEGAEELRHHLHAVRRRRQQHDRRGSGTLHEHLRAPIDVSADLAAAYGWQIVAGTARFEADLVRSGVACDCRALPLGAVPRAIVNRDSRGVVKLVAEAGTGRVRGVHAVADGAGEIVTAAVYAIRAGMTVSGLADTWALRLAAQSFSRDVTKLSCCAA